MYIVLNVTSIYFVSVNWSIILAAYIHLMAGKSYIKITLLPSISCTDFCSSDMAAL